MIFITSQNKLYFFLRKYLFLILKEIAPTLFLFNVKTGKEEGKVQKFKFNGIVASNKILQFVFTQRRSCFKLKVVAKATVA